MLPVSVPNPSLLEIENLRQIDTVRGQPRTVFEVASLSVQAGESVAVVGPPSEGASALARTAALLDRPAGGRVLLAGDEVTRASGSRLRALRRQLQYVGGDPRRALSPRLTIEAILAEPLEVHRMGAPAEQRRRVAGAAEQWHLNAHVLSARPRDLSGALCMRVALARAHILRPRALVVDGLPERVEAAAARPLLVQLARLARAEGFAWLWTTTNPDLAREFGNRVFAMRAGRLEQLTEAATP